MTCARFEPRAAGELYTTSRPATAIHTWYAPHTARTRPVNQEHPHA
ncbi:hypothetical protein [Streptomyces sp. NPDC057381]